ncbi:MAG: alpha/beta hydrolase [Myxococcota bacterium]
MTMIAENQSYKVSTPDGKELRLVDFSGENEGPPMLVMPGRGQSLEAMWDITEGFRQRGLRVFAGDWRGQGGSSREVAGEVGHIDCFSTYLEDHARLLKTAFPGERALLFGHSMGGHNSLRQATVNPSMVAGVIATAPMMEVNTKPYPVSVARALTAAALIPSVSRAPAPGSKNFFEKDLEEGGPTLSQDQGKWQRYMDAMLADRSLVTGGPTWGWVRAAMHSMDAALEKGVAEANDVPALIVLAGKDEVVLNETAEGYAKRMPNARTVLLPDAMHDVPQETAAILEPFWAAADQFLTEQQRSAK